MEEDFRRDVAQSAINKLQADAAKEAAQKAEQFIAGDRGRAIAEHTLNKAADSVKARQEAEELKRQNEKALRDALKKGPAGV